MGDYNICGLRHLSCTLASKLRHGCTYTHTHTHTLTKAHMPPSLNAHSDINTATCAALFFSAPIPCAQRLLTDYATHRLRYARCVSYAAPRMILMATITTTIHHQNHNLAKGRISCIKARGLLLLLLLIILILFLIITRTILILPRAC